MIVDSSAWIEFFRATGTPAHLRLRQAVTIGEHIVTPDPVVMEVLAGARDNAHAGRLRRVLFTFEVEPVARHIDVDSAAYLYRSCRSQGTTIRSLVDCLVAAIAVRCDEPVLAVDRDFEVLAQVTSLRLVQT